MKFVLLVLLAAGALSAPFNSKWETEDILSDEYLNDEAHQFSSFEKESSCGGKLHTGRVYVFNYVGETESKIQGSSPDSTGLQMQAQITIRSGVDCTFALQVSDAKLLMKSKNQRTFVPAVESAKFNSELTANVLKFKIADGNIVSLYPEATEAIHVLNIKRGMLSALQLSETTEEVDVNGRCNVHKESNSEFVVKSKNLSECTHRVHNELGFQSTSIEGESMPVNPLNSTSVCQYKLQNNGREIMTVVCTETHIFRPFSSGFETTAGALNLVRQTLKSVNVYDEKAVVMKVGEPSAMIFDNGKEDLKPVNTINNEVDLIMHRLVDQSQELGMSAKRDSAHEFTRLVMLLRRLDRKRMAPVWSKYIDCVASGICADNKNLRDVYRQYLLDALTYCGSTTCVTMIHNVIIDQTVSGENMNMFLQGISLVKSPTKGMIRDLTNIVINRPSRQAYLSLGTLIFRYCKMMPEECKYDSANPITQAENLLQKKLGQSCEGQENSDRVEELLMTIKSIGNAGRPMHLSSNLLSCAFTATHQNISLAAFDALRHMPCKSSVAEELLSLLENVDFDPERRIAAYVSVMKCPSEASLKRVVKMLADEKSRQVSSFIYSHLSNVNESSNPNLASTKAILKIVMGKDELRPVNLPHTMYSHAYEGSFFNDYLKSGVAVESHVVYHPNSYLPRTALLNVTANTLGVSLNVMEFAARMEGFETVIEDVFGPEGYYPNNQIMDLFSKTFFNKEQFDRFNQTFYEKDQERSRGKRSIASTLEDNIAELHQRANAKRPIPSGFMSMKMFGHEMRLFSYDDIFYTIDQIDNMNVIELLLKLAKGGEKTFTKSVMFLELTHTVPTGLGLPLKVKLLGSAVGTVRVDGKFDIRNMFWGPGSMELKGALHPSAVVEVSGQMGIHSHYIESGVFVNASLYTSHTMKGSVLYKAGQLLKVNVDTPENPIEVFNVSVSPFMYINEEAEIIEGVPRRLSPSFCINSTRVLGLGVCTSFAVPMAYREYEAPFFPLTGPAHFGAKLVRADEKLTTYQWLFSLKKNETVGKARIGKFVFSTPGATYERKFVGEIQYLETNKYRTLGFASINDDKKTEVTFSYNNNTNAMEATLESNTWTSKMFKTKIALTNDTFMKTTRQLGVRFVAEYDWYKFQHVTKLVNKTSSYMVHSKTTYFPGKHLTGEVEFYPEDKTVAVRFDANQLNQSVEFHGRLVRTSGAIGMNFTAHHLALDKSATFFIGYLNTSTSRRLVVNGTVLGRSAESSLGYYNTPVGYEVRMQVNAMGKTAGAFANYSSVSSSKGVNAGVFFEQYRLGGKLSAEKTENKRNLCSSVFYGTWEPSSLCMNVTVGASMKDDTNAILSWRVLQNIASLGVDYRVVDNKYLFNTSAVYNKKAIASNVWELDYKNWFDAQLVMNTSVFNRTFGLQWYTKKPMQHITVFGMDIKAMNQVLSLTSSYHREVSTENDAVTYGVIVEAAANNKKVPANFTILFENGNNMKGFSAILKAFSYQVKKSLAWMKPMEYEHSLVSQIALTKGDFTILSKKATGLLVLGEAEKAVKYTHEVIVWGKQFEYGYDVVYRNSTTISKAAHAVTVGVTYSKGRRVSSMFTFANSDKTSEMIVDVEYLPQKQVTHVVSFDKELKEMKVTVEFLPKMFATLRGQLDRVDGFKVTTDLEFTWENFRRLFHYTGGLANKTDSYKLFSRFSAYGKDLIALTEYNKNTKTGVASMSFNGKEIKVVYTNTAPRYVVALVYGINKLVEAELHHVSGRCVVELRTPTKSLLKSIAKNDEIHGIWSHELIAGGKSIIFNEIHFKSNENSVGYHFSVLGVKRFEGVAKLNKVAKSVFFHVSCLRKNCDLGLAGKWDDNKKAVTVSVELLSKVFGFIARVHPSKLVSSFHLFYNDRTVSGFHVCAAFNTIVFNVTITPTFTYQMITEVVEDHIVKVTMQRKANGEVINETTASYKLSPEESKVILQWNKDTIAAIRSTFVMRFLPALRNATLWTRNITYWTRNATVNATCATTKMFIGFVKNMTRGFLNKANRLDQLFDEFDFVAARDTIGAGIVSALRKSSDLTTKTLVATTGYLQTVHHHTPIIMKHSRELANLIIAHSQNVSTIVLKVARNLTESSKPLLATAMKLAREFQLRNKTMEVIVADFFKATNETFVKLGKVVLHHGKRYVKITMEKISNTKIPYQDKKIGETVEIILKKAKSMTNKYNLTELVRNATVYALQYKINGTTVRDHFTMVRLHFKQLPEYIKYYIKYAIRTSRVNYQLVTEKVEQRLEMLKIFATPLLDHLKQVNSSLYKRFGPIYMKAATQVYQNCISKCEASISALMADLKSYSTEKYSTVFDFVVPLVAPFKPYSKIVLSELRSLEIVDQKIGQALDMAAELAASKFNSSLTSVKDLLTPRLESLKLTIASIRGLTAEELVEKLVDTVVLALKEVSGKAVSVYESKDLIKKSVLAYASNIKSIVADVPAYLTKRTPSEWVSQAFDYSGDGLMKVVLELSKVTKQLSEIDLANPSWALWEEINIIGHLERYGVNSKLTKLIMQVKDKNITAIILEAVDYMQNGTFSAYSMSIARVNNTFVLFKRLHSILRAIPKKTFDEFYSDLISLLVNGKTAAIRQAYNVYDISLKKFGKMVDSTNASYMHVYEKYIVPAQGWYHVVKDGAVLVYKDNKDDTVRVYTFYKDVLVDYYTVNIDYHKERLYSQVADMKKNAELMLAKYEHLTWEQVGASAKEYAMAKYTIAVDTFKKYEYTTWREAGTYAMKYSMIQRAVAIVNSTTTKEVYANLTRKFNEVRVYINETMVPRIIQKYAQSVQYSQKLYKESLEKLEVKYELVKSQCLEMYNTHKTKTIVILYKEGRNAATVFVTEKWNKLNATTRAMYTKWSTKINEHAAYIIPEVIREAESILNQTLRASVILANETVKAYFPHYSIVMMHSRKFSGALADMTRSYVNQSMTALKSKSLELYNRYPELVQKIQQHPLIVNLTNCEVVKNISAGYIRLIVELKNKLALAKEYLNNLKSHTMVLKMQEKIEEYKVQITMYMNKLKEYMNHPTVLSLKENAMRLRDSYLYTYGKVYPTVKEAVEQYMVQGEYMYLMTTSYAQEHAAMFRQSPEECFWTNVRNAKTMSAYAKSQYDDLRQMNASDMKTNMMQWYADNTDEWFKAKVAEGLNSFEIAKTMVKNIPVYGESTMADMRSWVVERQSAVSASFTKCPIHAVMFNPIWAEFKDEIVDVAKINEAKELLFKNYALFREYYGQYMEIINATIAERKIQMLAKFDAIKSEVNRFVTEVTIEEMVTSTMEMSDKLIEKATAFKADTTAKFVLYRAKFNNTVRQYVAVARVYLADAKILAKKQFYALVNKIDQYYPVSSIDYSAHYETLKAKIALMKMQLVELKTQLIQLIKDLKHNATIYTIEFKKNMTEKAAQKWMSSSIRANLMSFKKMTIRQTIDAVTKLGKELPVNVTRFVKELKNNVTVAMAKINQQYVAPVTGAVKGVIFVVANEVNETAVFFYRYYGLKQKAVALVEMTKRNAKAVVPKVYTFVHGAALNASNATLMYLHSSMVAVDRFDYRQHVPDYTKYVTVFKAYANKVHNYVNVDWSEATITFTVPHPRVVKPTFSENIAVVNATARKIIVSANHTVWRVINNTKARAQNFTSMIMNATTELRSDIQTIYNVNRDAAIHFYGLGVTYGSYMVNQSSDASVYWMSAARNAATDAKAVMAHRMIVAMEKADIVFNDIYRDSSNWEEIYQKTKTYMSTAKTVSKARFEKYYTEIKAEAEKMYALQKEKYYTAIEDLKPYFDLLKISVGRMQNGENFSVAFREIIQSLDKYQRSVRGSATEFVDEVVATYSSRYPITAQLLTDYKTVHQVITKKYTDKMAMKYMTGKVRFERLLRKFGFKCGGMAKKALKALPSRQAFAMIYGYNHVMTFDKKFYDVPAFAHKDCTYLLAGDFHMKKNFTILSQRDNLVVMTPDMKVTIHQSGAVTTVVKTMKKGYVVQQTYKGLPVQSASGTCFKGKSLITCKFVQGIFVRCDPKHFLCTIKLSSWNYGKSKGILGTNNNEVFDEFTTPSGIITSSVTKLVSSWEVSGDKMCSPAQVTNAPLPCNQAPSRQCYNLMSSNTSEYARFFKHVDPQPFMKACVSDSTDCAHNKPYTTSHCNATAAYVAMLKMSGFRYAELPKDCLSHTTEDGKVHMVWDQWRQSASKDADITVLVSERNFMHSTGKVYGPLLYAIHKALAQKGFNIRYSLIGFGGNGIHEAPHVHTLAGENFNTIMELVDTLKTMPYTGVGNDSNDALAAIVKGTSLSYRPGAARIFLMLNSGVNTPSKVSTDEAAYALKWEANATLFVVDSYRFKDVVKGRVIGHTQKRVFPDPYYKPLPLSGLQFPSHDLAQLAESTDGGVFSNKIKSSDVKTLSTVLSDAMFPHIVLSSRYCKQCIMYPSKPICTDDRNLVC